MKHALALAVVAVALAGCGGATAEQGEATLWVTRDRGAHVLLVRTVPAGLTAMQALDRVADIETRYGGRFVQSIDGVEGNVGARRDWFYFVNGIEGDRSAAEVRLHAGDVEWWDYRSWVNRMRQPVVVGAFPEPFLQRDTYVLTAPSFASVGRGIARLTHGYLTRKLSPQARSFNVITIVRGHGFRAELTRGSVSARLGIETARRLVRDPSAVRFRYEVP